MYIVLAVAEFSLIFLSMIYCIPYNFAALGLCLPSDSIYKYKPPEIDNSPRIICQAFAQTFFTVSYFRSEIVGIKAE